MSETITTYKGFDKDMKCRGFQYEEGKEYEEDVVKCCNSGFHACQSPLDVFNYYAPGSGARYFVVEQSGKFSRDIFAADSKVASSKIKIGAEIGIPGLVKAHVEYVKKNCTNEHNVEPGKPATAGSYGAATAGSYGAATAGYRGAATAGDSGAATSRGSVTVGKNGVGTVRGNNVKIRGGIGAVLVCAIESEYGYDILKWKAVVVDGERIKADVWYTLKNGEFVEVEE